MGEIREVPGRDEKKSALGSVLQFKDFFSQVGSWVDKRKAEAGTPVFFANLGIPNIVVTDVVAASFILSAPKDVCDRMDNTGFGPIALRPQMIGPIRPAIVARGEDNARPRRFFDPMFEDARPRFDKVLPGAFDEITADWVSRGHIPLKEVHGVGGKLTGRWLLDIDLNAAEVGKWPGLTFGMKSDSWLVNLLLSVVNRLPGSAIKMSDRLVEEIRKAPRFNHIRQIGLDAGLGEEELLRQLAFLTLFNTGALGLITSAALAQLSLTPKWAAAIRNELGDAQLIPSTMNDFPVLHKVFIECCRVFGRPRAYYRQAHSDFDLPCGDGHSYRVKKGDTLLLSMRSVHHDEKMFADPHAFNPERFDENPDLANYVFIFGPHKRPYRCAPADFGMADVFFKYVLGRLLQSYDWEISPTPTVSRDATDDVTPDNVEMVNFRRRA
jgi:hypothetical protein